MKKIRIFALFAALALASGCTEMPTAPQADDEPEEDGRGWVGPVGNA